VAGGWNAWRMSDTAKAIWFSVPLVLVGALALLWPRFEAWHRQALLDELRRDPIGNSLSVDGREIRADRKTYSVADLAVAEIGQVRLVFEGHPFSGRTAGTMMIGRGGTNHGPAGASGSGARRLETSWIPHGTRCEFAGTEFEFVAGVLRIDGREIDAAGTEAFVRVDERKRVVEVAPIGR